MMIIEEIFGLIGEFIFENIVNHFFSEIVGIYDSKMITKILNVSFMTVANEYGFTKEKVPTFPAFIEHDVIENDIRNGLKIFGYKKNNTIIGCAGYTKYTDEIYKIKRLAVLPKYRHQGIGKKLLQNIERKIKKVGGKIIEIHIVNENEQLKGWYKKNGYEEIKIEQIDRLPFKVCIMQKEIGKNNEVRTYCA
jgi:N-acetylglutamate synthase-like GNAT family acetyltransferase